MFWGKVWLHIFSLGFLLRLSWWWKLQPEALQLSVLAVLTPLWRLFHGIWILALTHKSCLPGITFCWCLWLHPHPSGATPQIKTPVRFMHSDCHRISETWKYIMTQYYLICKHVFGDLLKCLLKCIYCDGFRSARTDLCSKASHYPLIKAPLTEAFIFRRTFR